MVQKVLSMRCMDEVFAQLEEFCAAQLARPSQSEALRALVKLEYERWKKDIQPAVDRATS